MPSAQVSDTTWHSSGGIETWGLWESSIAGAATASTGSADWTQERPLLRGVTPGHRPHLRSVLTRPHRAGVGGRSMGPALSTGGVRADPRVDDLHSVWTSLLSDAGRLPSLDLGPVAVPKRRRRVKLVVRSRGRATPDIDFD